jgi:uncharacterized protein YdhG (YjbR/CyaY superfamily)
MANNSSKKKIIPGGVDEYIAKCPEEVRSKLNLMRSAIHQVAPDAIETVSYFNFPGYQYEGYDYNGMFAWFSYKKPYIRLHVRPPVAKNHESELGGCKVTTGIISFPEEHEVSPVLIKKLVKASLTVMKNGTSK